MAKRRDFLDYVDLGAGLVQAANSTAIRDHLNALSQLEAEKLNVAQREAALQQHEMRTRDFVFDGTHLIGDLKDEAVGNPRRSLVLFYELRGTSNYLEFQRRLFERMKTKSERTSF